MPELTVRTEEVELPGGRILRVSSVEDPHTDGRRLVLERLVGSTAARSLVEPADGDRLVITEEAVSDLLRLVEEVTGP